MFVAIRAMGGGACVCVCVCACVWSASGWSIYQVPGESELGVPLCGGGLWRLARTTGRAAYTCGCAVAVSRRGADGDTCSRRPRAVCVWEVLESYGGRTSYCIGPIKRRVKSWCGRLVWLRGPRSLAPVVGSLHRPSRRSSTSVFFGPNNASHEHDSLRACDPRRWRHCRYSTIRSTSICRLGGT